MAGPSSFIDASFCETSTGLSHVASKRSTTDEPKQLETIDFNASRTFFADLEGPRSPTLRSTDTQSRGDRPAKPTNQGRRIDESAPRTGKAERRSRLREKDKERSTLDVLQKPRDGIAGLKGGTGEAAHDTAEKERCDKLRAEQRATRRLIVQKQVEDGIKAIKLEKDRARALVEEERNACRKWLSGLQHEPLASASTATSDTVDLYAAIGCQLRGFWQDSRPAASIQAQREEVVADMQRAITRRWPGQGLQVAAFGSSVTGLVTRTSDLDLVLLDPTRPYGAGTPPELCRPPRGPVRHSDDMPEWYSVHQIANAIRNSSKFHSVVAISGARVPIVKMVHRKHNIPADININERFGLFNSRLISAYADLQPDLVRPLIFFLKHWFSRRELNDPAGQRGPMTFSSYTIALMALQVLQTEGLLPNLQSPELLDSLKIRPDYLYSRPRRPRRGKKGRQDVVEDVSPPRKYNVTFASYQTVLADAYKKKALEFGGSGAASPPVKGQDFSADWLLGRMLASFVRFYAQLDRHAQAISVLSGAPLQRPTAPKPRHVFFQSASEDGDSNSGDDVVEDPMTPAPLATLNARAPGNGHADVWADDDLVVQDPFIVDRNTTRNIKVASIERWRREMERAISLLALNRADETPRMRLEGAPLVLDLCIPQHVLRDMEAEGDGLRESSCTGGEAASKEPWKFEEEAAAREREVAQQVAKVLRKEKKKGARKAKRSEARRLQEEAAMVEEMIDGIETGRITGLMSGNQLHERWRLRADEVASNDSASLPPIPFTFSVAKPSDASSTASSTPKKADANDRVGMNPTWSARRRTSDGSSSSEDIDLVASRLKQEVRLT